MTLGMGPRRKPVDCGRCRCGVPAGVVGNVPGLLVGALALELLARSTPGVRMGSAGGGVQSNQRCTSWALGMAHLLVRGLRHGVERCRVGPTAPRRTLAVLLVLTKTG